MPGLRDQINEVLEGMKRNFSSSVQTTRQGVESELKKAREPGILTGAAKVIAGGLGAVPTAVGKTIEQIPAAVGGLIGAVPRIKADYAANPSLELMGQGTEEIKRGVSDIGGRMRSGIMTTFGLQEPPATTPAPQPTAKPAIQPATLPSARPVPVPIAAAVPETGRGVSPETFTKMQTVGREAVAGLRNKVPGGFPDYDVIPANDGKGSYTLSPKPRPETPAEEGGLPMDVSSIRTRTAAIADTMKADKFRQESIDKIDARIAAIESDPKTVSRKKHTLINDLLGKRMTLVGQDVVAGGVKEGQEVQREGFGVQRRGQDITKRGQDITGKHYEAMSVTEERKARIEDKKLGETSRYHDILAEEAKERRQSNEAIRTEANRLKDEGKFDTLIDRFGSYEDIYGAKGKDPNIAIFKLIDSGYDVNAFPKEWKPTADKMIADMKAFVKAQKAAKSKLSDSELKVEFYNQLRGIKGVNK